MRGLTPHARPTPIGNCAPCLKLVEFPKRGLGRSGLAAAGWETGLLVSGWVPQSDGRERKNSELRSVLSLASPVPWGLWARVGFSRRWGRP